MRYSELHCHSAFSLLDGASSPEELVLRAKQAGLSALALTDHNDMGGAVRFAQAAREVGLDAIIGAEITLEDASHLTLLAENTEGYKNICALITSARMNNRRGVPAVTYAELMSRSAGMVALSGCPHGGIPAALARSADNDARRLTRLMVETFGDAFFLELWDHHLPQEAVLCRRLLEIGRSYSIPSVVTNNVHYATPAKRIIHDVLTCLRHEVTLQSAGRRLRPNGSWYLKSPGEMYELWQHHPEGLKNTEAISERCRFRLGLLKPSLPEFPLPDHKHDANPVRGSSVGGGSAAPGGHSPPLHAFETDQGRSPSPADSEIRRRNAFLRKLVWEGAAKRYGVLDEKHRHQLNHELELITRLGLAPYFLIMWDIVRFAQSQGIAVQGRGSAANSAVCYCLAITAVDPIGMDLLFERFLSEGRNEPPDIDLDIAHQEREKVLQYVYEKYGREHAAMVCEVITYRGRSAVRDAARVLGFSQEQADRLAAESDRREALEAAKALAAGGAERAGVDASDRRVRLLIKVVAGLDRLPRHRSIHVGGFVLSGEPLGCMVPIEPAAMKDRTVIQWDKDDLDPVGMIKIDLLGLGMLTMIQEALKLVKRHRNKEIDLAHLDMHDPAIYEMFCKADTVGVFQVESRAQMSILPKLRPRCFYDIVVSIALVRPGPIQGNIVHPYIRRRRGEEEVTYLHPSLEPILKRTLGVPLFQEQGMRLAIVAAGFSAAEADKLRRVMSHKRSHEKMARLCLDLAAGMRANGFTEEAIATITHQLQAFASYGFPESHAASFALLVFASAHLKKYFPPEFYCAMLNAQPMGFYSPDALIRDAIRHNVAVRPVDLSRSIWDCTLEDTDKEPALRIGLRYVQGLGRKAKEALEAAWQEGGPFTSVKDVCRRSGLGWKALQVLARAGAFESLHAGRREALWEVLAQARRGEELPLFAAAQEGSSTRSGTRKLPPMSPLEQTIADYQTQRLTTGRHPMSYYREWVQARGIKSCGELSRRNNGETLTVAGSVLCRQRPETAKGFVFMTLEDETGMANIIIRPDVFEEYKRVLLGNAFLSITGRLQAEEGVCNIIAASAEPLPPIGDRLSVPSRDFQ